MKESIGIKILVAVLIILIIIAATLLGIEILKEKELNGKIQASKENNNINEEIEIVEIKEPQTFLGVDRPIAVMIDNHKSAMQQAGLNDAYLVYEIIVEGGETRMMALFKGASLDKIGPIRSSRHYFLDYALENDAIYVHFGWSPQAQSDISKLGVNNINGMYYDGGKFWRVKDKYAPHNAVTSTENILDIAKKLDYRTTSTKESVLNYVAEEVDLDTDLQAKTITIPYSYYNTVKYEYDEELKEYVRYSRGTKQVDWDTKETVTTKNIIVVKCDNWTLNDGSGAGRQTIDNVKVLNGYYITNGKAVEITAEKSTRSSQTVYKDLEGNEIEVNDGNTFIQICPLNADVKIEPGEPKVQETANIIEE